MHAIQPPVSESAINPAGPHKGWGHSIDDVISCGDVSTTPRQNYYCR